MSENFFDKVSQQRWQIGEYTFDPSANELLKDGERTAITAKMAKVLLLLIAAKGEVVHRENIYRQVWGDVQVSEQLIARAISDLRKALGDEAKAAKYIQTLPKSGYRIVARVSAIKLRPSTKSGLGPRSLYGIVIGLSLVLILIFWLQRYSQPKFVGHSELPALSLEIPVTSQRGVENSPNISPDGTTVAYAAKSSTQQKWQILLKDRLSGELQILFVEAHDQFAPRFSPDGKSLAYTRYRLDPNNQNSRECDLVVVALANKTRQIFENQCSGRFYMSLDWAPNSRGLFYTDDLDQDKRAIAYWDLVAETSQIVSYPIGDGVSDYSPRVSLDGKQLLFVRGQLKPNHRSTLMMLQVSDILNDKYQEQKVKKAIPLTKKSLNIWGLAWVNHHQFFYVSHQGDYVGLRFRDLATQSDTLIRSGELHRIDYHIPSATLIYAKSTSVSDIFKISNLTLDQQSNDSNQQNVQSRLNKLIDSTRHDLMPRISPNGQQLAFVSEREGHPQIWLATAEGKNSKKLTSFPDLDIVDFSWSPNGKKLVANLRADGKVYHYIVDIETQNLSLLSTDSMITTNLSWSQQQQWMIADCLVKKVWQICRIPSEGGKPEILTTAGGVTPYMPNQSDFIYFSRAGNGLWKMPLAGGQEELVWSEFPEHSWKNFVIYEHVLYYVRPNQEQMQLVKRDLFSSQEIVLATNDIDWGSNSIDISVDGVDVYFSASVEANDDLYQVTVE